MKLQIGKVTFSPRTILDNIKDYLKEPPAETITGWSETLKRVTKLEEKICKLENDLAEKERKIGSMNLIIKKLRTKLKSANKIL